MSTSARAALKRAPASPATRKVAEQASAPRYLLESVNNALKLLLMFRDRDEIRLWEAQKALSVGPSTAHRLMNMLVYHGFASRDAARRSYRAGSALTELGLSHVNRIDIRALARPVLEQLALEAGETALLAVLEGGHIRIIEGVESERTLRIGGSIGAVWPAYATSAGKALLAELPEAEIRRLYPRDILRGLTPKTITRRSQLERELAKVRRAGFATNIEENEEGLCSVAVAVRHPSRGALAAVTVAAPTQRSDSGQVRRLVEMCRASCVRISESMS